MGDIPTLTDELAEIYKQKQEVEERLNTRYGLRGRGRGRGQYGMAGVGRGSYERPPEPGFARPGPPSEAGHSSRDTDRGQPDRGAAYSRDMGMGQPDRGAAYSRDTDRGQPDRGAAYGRDMDRGQPDRGAAYSRGRPPAEAEYSRERGDPDRRYSRDKGAAEAGYGRDQPPAEPAIGRPPRDQPGGGLSSRLQDRLSGLRPGTRQPDHLGSSREERLAASRSLDPPPEPRGYLTDRARDPRPSNAREGFWDARDPSTPLPDRFEVPKVMSAVVVNGETRMPSQIAEPERAPGLAKRPRETADSANPAAAKRNKRMFAGLLGTLQRFKADDEKFSQSRVAQQRAEAMQRAEEQTAENERNAKQAAREAFQRQRREEINKKRQLDLKVKCKKLEINLAARTAHHSKLFGFLKTAAGPPVLWMPAFVSEGVQQLLDARKGDFETWQVDQKAALQTHVDTMALGLEQSIARTAPKPPPAPGNRQDDEKMAEANVDAEDAAADELEAETEAEAEDQDQDQVQDREQEVPEPTGEEVLAAGGSPVPIEAQDTMDADDRYAGGQPGEEYEEADAMDADGNA